MARDEATSSPPSKPPDTVSELLRRRLREVKRSPEELAAAVEVPTHYIDDLIAGSRRPPLPGRTDIYVRMTSFLRLRRNDIAACASAERAVAAAVAAGPGARVRRLVLDLCEPGTARALERRRARDGSAELAAFIQRLLDVTQGAVRRTLDDQIGLRLRAAERGSTYLAMRFRVLEFLDVTADTLSAEDLSEFLRPRVALWDVDLASGVLRVVLRTPGARDRPARRGNGDRVT
ncbi:MAG: hypothetical protein ACREMJ_00905 [Gemmatimonadales bacterium]